MGRCELEEIFGAVADTLPEQLEQSCVLSAETLPAPPASLETDRLVMRAGKHQYASYTRMCVDIVEVQAYKRTYALLALCVLAKVFHAEPREVRINFTSPHSTVRALVLDYEQRAGWDLIEGYAKRPHQLMYRVERLEGMLRFTRNPMDYPWWYLPLFRLSDADDVEGPGDDRGIERDILYGVGSDYGSVLFAQVLLNLSRANEEANEVALEGEHGYGGVGRGSAEVSVWLPGGIGWLDELMEAAG